MMANNMEISTLKVLLVDDHMIMRGMLRQYLAAAGITAITEASNGSEALRKIEYAASTPAPFNVVLADWNMPTMDGLSLLKEVRANKTLNSLAFVMITAESEKAKIMEALQAGATSYLVKPFSHEDIDSHLAKIFEWLKARS